MIALSLLSAVLVYGLLAWFAIRMFGWLGKVCAFPSISTNVLQGLILVSFVLLPTWDIIPSRLYFEHLCETKASIKVFRTVEVDQSYLRPDGVPDDKKLLDRYVQSSKWNRDFSSWAHITKIEGAIQDRETGELLGTATDYLYGGGWINSRIAPMSSTTCPNYPNHSIHSSIWAEVFKLKRLRKSEGA